MDNKGFNQVDLAIGFLGMMLVISLAFAAVSNYLTPSLDTFRAAELRSAARALSESVFNDVGTNEDWHLYNASVRPSLGYRIKRTPVELHNRESAVTNHLTYMYINFSALGLAKPYNRTIKVYDGAAALDTNLSSQVDTNNDFFLEEVNVTFRVNVSAGQRKLVHIYYSRDNKTAATYTALAATATHMNRTMLPEETFVGVTSSKLEQMLNMSFRDIADGLGTTRGVRITVKNITGSADWAFGDPLPKREIVSVFARKILHQNKTGHIRETEGMVAVW